MMLRFFGFPARMARKLFSREGEYYGNARGMSDPAAPMAVDEADLDSLPVQIVLELGRLPMSVGELRQLAPGMLLPISHTADDAVDIVANGRRIGRAGLVRIGDGLGVRISRLTQDG